VSTRQPLTRNIKIGRKEGAGVKSDRVSSGSARTGSGITRTHERCETHHRNLYQTPERLLTVIDDAGSGQLLRAQLALDLELATQAASVAGPAGTAAADALEQTAGVTVAAHTCSRARNIS